MAQGVDRDEIVDASRRLLGSIPEKVEFPGGRSRRSVRVCCEGKSYIFSLRRLAGKAEREVWALETLGRAGAPVPELVAFDGTWLVQEDLGSERLSTALNFASPETAEAGLVAAVEALSLCHRAGKSLAASDRVRRLGATLEWTKGLAGFVGKVSQRLDLGTPELDLAELHRILRPRVPSLVKWDARPGNACIRNDGSVGWFDWEHCGLRNPTDDMVWLLADEFVPDNPALEAQLVEQHAVSVFGDFLDLSIVREYYAVFAALHSAARLELILSKRKQHWWDWRTCVEFDRIGVTLEAGSRLCRRGARVSEQSALTRALSPWFLTVEEHLKAL